MTTAVSKKLFENAILQDLFFVKKRNSEDAEFKNDEPDPELGEPLADFNKTMS
jgi:hypothetical protein